jgi:DNA-binding MurR/RpiR family transcriptional regulator
VKLTHPVFGAMNVGAHQVVLAAFRGPRPLHGVCDHINANPSDNRVENLRWVTQAVNVRHAAALGRLSKRTGPRSFSRLDEDQIRAIRRARGDGATLDLLAKQFGVSTATISRAVNCQTWREVL